MLSDEETQHGDFKGLNQPTTLPDASSFNDGNHSPVSDRKSASSKLPSAPKKVRGMRSIYNLKDNNSSHSSSQPRVPKDKESVRDRLSKKLGDGRKQGKSIEDGRKQGKSAGEGKKQGRSIEEGSEQASKPVKKKAARRLDLCSDGRIKQVADDNSTPSKPNEAKKRKRATSPAKSDKKASKKRADRPSSDLDHDTHPKQKKPRKLIQTVINPETGCLAVPGGKSKSRLKVPKTIPKEQSKLIPLLLAFANDELEGTEKELTMFYVSLLFEEPIMDLIHMTFAQCEHHSRTQMVCKLAANLMEGQVLSDDDN